MIDQNILNQFKNIVGPNDFWDQPTDLALYAFDSSVEKPVLPDVVVRPKTTKKSQRSANSATITVFH